MRRVEVVSGRKFSQGIRWLVLLMPLLLVLIWPGLSYGADSDSRVRIAVEGLVLDEADQPLAAEELQFSIFTGPYSEDIEETVETDRDGKFRFTTIVRQEIYLNSDLNCAMVQIRVGFRREVDWVEFWAGEPMVASAPSDLEKWAEDGRYREESTLLFHSMRIAEDGEGDFPDLQVTMGSAEDPCVFRLPVSEAPSVLVTVKHLDDETEMALAVEEQYILPISHLDSTVIEPVSLAGWAPISVVRDDETQLEAERGSPIHQYELAPPEQDVELIIYYHPDRDEDGIPDHLVTEQLLTTEAEPIPDQPPQTTIYAHRDWFQPDPPELTGYQYIAWETAADQWATDAPLGMSESLTELAPKREFSPDAQRITRDVAYCYLYEPVEDDRGGGKKPKPGGGGSGQGSTGDENKEDNKGPTEETSTGGTGDSSEAEPPPDPAEEWPEEPEVESPEPAPDQTEEVSQTEAEPERDTPSTTPSAASAPQPPAEAVLSQAEREERRNITFVKRSLAKAVAPGDEIPYAFSGFENAFPYPLDDFTILDQPDPGLDFISVQLPAFRNGAGIQLDVTCVTSQQEAIVLVQGHPADQPFTATAPPLTEGVYITEVYVSMGQVPAGFGQDDQVIFTFRVWEDPPADELHNLGLLYYSELGEPVAVSAGGSEDDRASVWVQLKDLFSGDGGDWPKREALELSATTGMDQHSRQNMSYGVIVLLMLFAAMLAISRPSRKPPSQG